MHVIRSSKVLKILENLDKKPKSFWKLICSINAYDEEDDHFHLNPCVNTKIKSFYDFQDAFIGLMSH